MDWLIITLIGIGGFIISLFFEEARDLYSEILETIMEGIGYFFTFEWIGDIGELFGSMFENIGELSMYGLGFGLLGFGLIFATRSYMVEPFVDSFPPIQRTLWTIATYITVFIGSYLLGKGFENTG